MDQVGMKMVWRMNQVGMNSFWMSLDGFCPVQLHPEYSRILGTTTVPYKSKFEKKQNKSGINIYSLINMLAGKTAGQKLAEDVLRIPRDTQSE